MADRQGGMRVTRSWNAAAAARRAAGACGAVLALGLATAAPASAADLPVWEPSVNAVPTHLRPGSSGQLRVAANNVGTGPFDGTAIRFDVTLPPGVTWRAGSDATCSATADGVSCAETNFMGAASVFWKALQVDVDPTAPVGDAPVRVTVSGGGAAATATIDGRLRIDPVPAGFGLDTFSARVLNEQGEEETRAGAQRWIAVTDFAFNTELNDLGRVSTDAVENIDVALPAGFAGKAAAIPICSSDEYAEGPGGALTGCPANTQVGLATVTINVGGTVVSNEAPVFNLAPPRGSAAMFGWITMQTPVRVLIKVRTDGDYGLTAQLRSVSSSVSVLSSRLALWGDPGDPRHFERRPAGPLLPSVRYLSNPFDCSAGPLTTSVTASSWQEPSRSDRLEDQAPALTGCDLLDFRPSIAVTPETTKADSSTGLSVDLDIAQGPDTGAPMTPPLKDAVVTLPQGVSINPSVASGLEACTDERFGLKSAAAEDCPAASRIGALTIESPLIAEPLVGDVYTGTQLSGDPLSGRMFRILMQAEGGGVTVKLEGAVRADPLTGQLTTSFLDNPQLPFEHLRLTFKGGERGLLATPAQCGLATTKAALSAWSGQETKRYDTFEVSVDGAGAPCPAGLPFAPAFSAGTTNPLAGALSPFTLSLAREDGTQALSTLNVELPPGLLGYISRVPRCGAAAAAAGSCGEESRVGSVRVESGVGANPFALPGRVYITDGYKGGPYGLAIVVPAKAGPFDLGTVVVRAAIHVDKAMAALTVVSDPFPQVVKGVPLRMRSVALAIDRNGFMFNPTSCAPSQVRGIVGGAGGANATVAKRFQVRGCKALPFAPKLTLKVGGKGKTAAKRRTPLTAVVSQTPGQAAMKRVRVLLPLSIAASLEPLQNGCPLAVFEAGGCAESTKIGSASATTPVLPGALSGGAWFVRYPGERLPRIVVQLRGEVAIDLVAKVRVTRQLRLETTFDTVPDVPISQFKLALRGDRNAPLTIVKDLCARRQYAGIGFTAHNGRGVNRNLRLAVAGCKQQPRAAKRAAKKKLR
ncbi:hypothetical protein VSS74_05780 [Conexibacter stalactiti]|uniref:Uncharacterized protein n=1 Tax=Conexibacter stalactiti TaxID=1940611 RepID=A0ABU4HKK8_9ACTN|nr:hypothetical protein [Conexibacter stalactiti]MDW5593833.1 hypothetical protein [Conexibacter stalactiti]MEC5034475.1 hypothetical protein [Conexibacter stalactiti]